ncbi:uncharacterized protein LOC126969152 [Leptidea sinapis]|uniref:uncharacterized protein LOC126969152 n=1 Tax=Leptidea sinapis TaxID=189913 RepID=UPI0021C28A7A|nr:uncharacterized protein LOC126969152 [Leptidea sinapis]
MVSLDIEGAFDSAWWPAIKHQLAARKCPRNLYSTVCSYLNDREVIIRYAGAECVRPTTKGCVQGSIGGPIFWNLLIDPLLGALEEEGLRVQAFADDVVLVFSGSSPETIARTANSVLRRVYDWGLDNKLRFAPHKTNAMVITKKLKVTPIQITMGGESIKMVTETKILGLIIDHRLSFKPHVADVCRKATAIYGQLSRAAKTTWGLNPEVVRTIYIAAVEPIVLYASSVWVPAVDQVGVRKLLDAVQRGFARKISRAYKTASLGAALILSGILPLDLRIREVAELYRYKRGEDIDDMADRKAEQRVSFLDAPHPALAPEVEFCCLEETQTETDVVEVQDDPGEGEGYLQVYTDGSKIQGRVGAGISYRRRGLEVRARKLKLENYCSVFQAEMCAISKAIEDILKMPDMKVEILSDSRSSLELLRDRSSFHPIAFEIKNLIRRAREMGKTIRFRWVRAHVGIEGNERADHLAKDAALHSKLRAAYDGVPISTLRRKIRAKTLEVWQERYTTGQTASVTKAFLPDVVASYKLVREDPFSALMAQIITGHGGFSAYLHRFGLKDSPVCICDGRTDESALHLVLECPRFGRWRCDLEVESGMAVTEANLPALMVKPWRNALVKFCIKILADVLPRNGSNIKIKIT